VQAVERLPITQRTAADFILVGGLAGFPVQTIDELRNSVAERRNASF
jgi:hypothetical protein